MSARSFVYRHVLIYRFVMDILYLGKYKARFTPVIDQIKELAPGSRVLELCFGDTYIAEYCKKTGHQWTGFDINTHFVEHAQRKGYRAYAEDIANLATLPQAEVCIMTGSLYHFHSHASAMLSKMFKSADMVVISEPVVNLSSSKGLIGFLARRWANAGKGNEEFRYTASSLMAMLKENSKTLNYQIVTTLENGKDLIIKLKKN